MSESWKKYNLGDVCEIIGGGTPSKSNPDFYRGDNWWATVRDMKNDLLFNTEFKISDVAIKKSATNIIPKGNVIIATRVGLGKICLVQVDSAINQDLKGIIPKKSNQLIPKYIFYWFKSISNQIIEKGTGATVKGVKLDFIRTLKIPIPHLPEQQRIVDILDQSFAAIDQAIENTTRNLEKISILFKSYSESLFNQLSIDYPVLKFPQLCKLERGSSPRPIKNYVTIDESGVNWIKIGDATKTNKYIYTTQEKITPEGAKKSRYVKAGDLLLTNSMSYGKAYILKTDGYIHDGWFAIKPKDSIVTEYFWHALVSPNVEKQFHHLASGAIVKNISSDLVNKVSLPLPPIKIQTQIAETLDDFSSQLQEILILYQKKLKLLHELKQSILNKAFNGDLS